jgi:hypothetical protein
MLSLFNKRHTNRSVFSQSLTSLAQLLAVAAVMGLLAAWRFGTRQSV